MNNTAAGLLTACLRYLDGAARALDNLDDITNDEGEQCQILTTAASCLRRAADLIDEAVTEVRDKGGPRA